MATWIPEHDSNWRICNECCNNSVINYIINRKVFNHQINNTENRQETYSKLFTLQPQNKGDKAGESGEKEDGKEDGKGNEKRKDKGDKKIGGAKAKAKTKADIADKEAKADKAGDTRKRGKDFSSTNIDKFNKLAHAIYKNNHMDFYYGKETKFTQSIEHIVPRSFYYPIGDIISDTYYKIASSLYYTDLYNIDMGDKTLNTIRREYRYDNVLDTEENIQFDDKQIYREYDEFSKIEIYSEKLKELREKEETPEIKTQKEGLKKEISGLEKILEEKKGTFKEIKELLGKKEGGNIKFGKQKIELPDVSKGIASRAFFYILFTYGPDIYSKEFYEIYLMHLQNKKSTEIYKYTLFYNKNYIQTMIDWYKKFAPSAYELEIYCLKKEHQGNSNPFIENYENIKQNIDKMIQFDDKEIQEHIHIQKEDTNPKYKIIEHQLNPLINKISDHLYLFEIKPPSDKDEAKYIYNFMENIKKTYDKEDNDTHQKIIIEILQKHINHIINEENSTVIKEIIAILNTNIKNNRYIIEIKKILIDMQANYKDIPNSSTYILERIINYTLADDEEKFNFFKIGLIFLMCYKTEIKFIDTDTICEIEHNLSKFDRKFTIEDKDMDTSLTTLYKSILIPKVGGNRLYFFYHVY
jgi:hypothetical protein